MLRLLAASLSAAQSPPSLRLLQDVAGASHSVDELAGMAAIDLAAQPAHMGLNDVGLGVEVEIPDALQQHRAGHHATCVAQQVFEQLEFAWLQINAPAPTRYGALQEVKPQVGDCDLRRHFLGWGASGQRIHPGQEFSESKWLYEVVIAAGFQPLHPIVYSAQGGQHQ